MEKSIIINPVNDEIQVMATAVKLRNDFASMGFQTRGAFINTVQDYMPKYKEYKLAIALERWWASREKNEEINNDLDVIINKLRYE